MIVYILCVAFGSTGAVIAAMNGNWSATAFALALTFMSAHCIFKERLG